MITMEEVTVKRSASWILFLACMVALPCDLASQQVEGRVLSTEDEVITGASVLLLDEAFAMVAEGLTDAEGHYSLRALTGGEYMLMVEREGFANQTSGPVTVPASGTLEHDIVITVQRVGDTQLAVADTMSDRQLLAAAIADACRGVFVPEIHAILFGSIKDRATEMAIPRAVAVALWDDRFTIGLGDRRVEGRTDNSGAYLLCNAPANEDIRVRAEALETEGPEVPVRLTAGTMRRLNLVIDVNDPSTPGDILGRVMDQYTGRPVAGAQVRIKDTQHRTVTNDRGIFYMAGVRWGLYAMTVSHVAYGSQEQAVRVIGGRAHELEIRMPPDALEIAPLLVRIRPRSWFGDMAGLEARIQRGFGLFILREEIEERGTLNLGDLMRGLPGVRVTQSGSAITGNVIVQLRNARDMLNNPCPPVLWTDGVKWGKDPRAYNQFLGIELEAIEIFRGPAEVPGEFLDGDSSCGVVVIWTRRGAIR